MKHKKLTIFLSLFLIFSTIVCVAPITAFAATSSIYVSPTGNDTTGNGTINYPYLTITKARDIVKAISKTANTGITVYLRGGEYFTSSKILFDSTHSGTASCPVTYTSYPGEKAIITGAKSIPSAGFSNVTDSSILNRITDSKAKQKLVEVKLSDYGIDDGTITPTGWAVGTGNEIPQAELFFDNSPMTLSRWPNKSMVEISALSDICSLYTIGGSGTAITLTRTTSAANDTTLNLSIANGTCVGLTAAPTSANTTAGVAGTTAQVETATVTGTITTAGNATVILTASGLAGSPTSISVPVLVGDSATTVATKIKTALTNQFKYSDTRIENWQFNNDLWLHGFFVSSGWGDCKFNIMNINATNKVITTSSSPNYQYNMQGKYYYYLNILEEIDTPGEYYIDRTTHKMYFYPPYDIGSGTVKMTYSQNILVEGTGLKYVNFNNLIFEGTRNSAINITGSSSYITIDSCIIRNIGKTGVFFNSSTTTNCTVKNSEVKYTGKGGLYFYGGNRSALTSGNLVSQNNHITEFNRIWKTGNPGIFIASGVGAIVKNNLIHDSPHNAIVFNGNDNLINQNELYDLTQDTDDAGAVYSGRDYTYRGNVISNNFIHDGRSIVTSCGTSGVYLDDYMSSATVYNNIISGFHQGMVLGGGRDHIINNNLILDCDNSINFDDRNKSLTPASLLTLATYTPYYNLTNWKTKYPLVNAMKDDLNPGYPKGNTITNNAIYNASAMNLSSLVTAYGTVTDNKIFTNNILLNDKSNYDYGLSSFSSIYTDLPSFQPVDFESIGLKYVDVTKSDTFDLKMPSNNSTNVNTTNGVDFGWQQIAYADKYNLIIAKDAAFSNIVVDQIVEDNYCTINNLKSNTNYYWKVKSVQDASSVPRTIDCDTQSFMFSTSNIAVLPSSITNATAYIGKTASADRICLKWSDAQDANSYNIYRSSNGGTLFDLIASNIGTTTYVDTSSNTTVGYLYQIRGVNNVGEGNSSNFSVKTITSLDISSTNTTLSLSGTSAVQAKATLSDGNVIDLTATNIFYSTDNASVVSVSQNGIITPKTVGNTILTVGVKNTNGTSISKKLYISVYYTKKNYDGFEGSVYGSNRSTLYKRTGDYSYMSNGTRSDSYYDADTATAEMWIYDDGYATLNGGLYLQPPSTGPRFTIGPKNGINYYTVSSDVATISSPVSRTVGWHQIIIETKNTNSFAVYIDGMLSYTSNVSLGGYHVFGRGGTSGHIYYDDFSFLDITTPSAVTDLSISGLPSIGNTLSANYIFYDYNGGSESGTTYKWYSSATPNGTYTDIAGQNTKNYTISNSDIGKYIKFVVEPMSDKTTQSGSRVVSDAIGPILMPFSVSATASVTNGILNVVADLKNNRMVQISPNIVFVTYNEAEKVLDVKTMSSLYNSGEQKIVNYSYNCGTMGDKYFKIFVLDGFANIKPLSTQFDSRQ